MLLEKAPCLVLLRVFAAAGVVTGSNFGISFTVVLMHSVPGTCCFKVLAVPVCRVHEHASSQHMFCVWQ
jgi:hypothetical protein